MFSPSAVGGSSRIVTSTRWRPECRLMSTSAKSLKSLEMPVKRPVFILGMPRTGTTVVSYLMSTDPANRSMLRWEAYNVVPPAAPGELKTDPRCLAEVAKDEAMLKANPTVGAAHWEPGDGPTECVHLVAQDFRSLMFAVLSVTPTYHDWILFCDMATAFEHRKRVLQILQTEQFGAMGVEDAFGLAVHPPAFSDFPGRQGNLDSSRSVRRLRLIGEHAWQVAYDFQ